MFFSKIIYNLVAKTTNDAVAEELQAFRDKLLPKTSKKEYESRFSKYTKWLKEKHPKLQPNDPNALKIYFNYLELNCAASSVISIFSAIRSIVKVKYQMDIIDLELTTALKKISKAHKYRKSLVFEEEQIEKFLIEAPEQEFGYFKLIWLVGFYGGCRKCELYNITIQKSKTDPAANGRTKLPLNVNEKLCPFRRLGTYIASLTLKGRLH